MKHWPAHLLVLAVATAVGCGVTRNARFADLDVIQEISDDRPIPMPARRLFPPLTYADAFGRRFLVAGLDPTRIRDAGDVNALDQVPPSSWFVRPAGGALGAVQNTVNGPPAPPLVVLKRRPESG